MCASLETDPALVSCVCTCTCVYVWRGGHYNVWPESLSGDLFSCFVWDTLLPSALPLFSLLRAFCLFQSFSLLLFSLPSFLSLSPALPFFPVAMAFL